MSAVEHPVKIILSDLSLATRVVLDHNGFLCVRVLGIRVGLQPQNDPTVPLSVRDPDVPDFDIFQILDLRSASPQVAREYTDPVCEALQATRRGIPFLNAFLMRHPVGTPRSRNRLPGIVTGIDHEAVLGLDMVTHRPNRCLVALLAFLAIMDAVVLENGVSSWMLFAFHSHDRHSFSEQMRLDEGIPSPGARR
jgi:hypothetical protein